MPWYCDYHTVVLSVPRRGTASTKPFWFFGTVKWGLTPNRFAGSAPAMHPTWIGKKVNRNSTNATRVCQNSLILKKITKP